MRVRTLLNTAISAAATAALVAGATVSATAASPVERIDGADRYQTAVAMAREVFQPGVDTVYLASGEGFADAIAAAPVAGRSNSPLLLTRSRSLPREVQAELERLSPKRVVIAGGEAAVAPSVAEAVRSAVPSAAMERAAGRDRYDTAAQLSAGAIDAGDVDRVYLVTGRDFPDALAAAPAAAAPGAALLTMPGNQMTPEGLSELARLAPREIVTVGAVDTLLADLIAQVEQHAADLRDRNQSAADEAARRATENFLAQLSDDDRQRFERVSGQDRYETSARMSRQTTPQSGVPSTYIASGRDYPDALVSAAAAARTGSPVLLVNESGVPAPVRAELERLRPQQVIVAGGPAAVPDSVATEIARSATPPAPSPEPTRPAPAPTPKPTPTPTPTEPPAPVNGDEHLLDLVRAFDTYQHELVEYETGNGTTHLVDWRWEEMTAVAATLDGYAFTGEYAIFADAFEAWAGALGQESLEDSVEGRWRAAFMTWPVDDLPGTPRADAYFEALDARVQAIIPVMEARGALADELEVGSPGTEGGRMQYIELAAQYQDAAYEAYASHLANPDDDAWGAFNEAHWALTSELSYRYEGVHLGVLGFYDYIGPTSSPLAAVLGDALLKISLANTGVFAGQGASMPDPTQMDVGAHTAMTQALERIDDTLGGGGLLTVEQPAGWDWQAFVDALPIDED